MIDRIRLAARRLADRIDALAARERALIFVALLAVLFVVASTLLFTPQRSEQKRIEQSIGEKRTQMRTLEIQVQGMADRLARDPNAEKHARLEALRARIQQSDEALGRLVAGFVNPREMAQLVEQVLKKNRSLEFVKVENLAPVPVAGDTQPAAPEESPIYKHGFRIEMKGDYRSIVTYLRALEELPWKVFWGEVMLESETYPVSRVQVVIYTLSRNRGWIGT